jgi:hypothetical protein
MAAPQLYRFGLHESGSHSVIFFDEATVHGVANRHNCRIWAWQLICPSRVCSRQSQGHREVRHHVGPNYRTLNLPREHYHDWSLLGYATELSVPTDSNWTWRPHFPTRWCTSPFCCRCTNCSRRTISWSMDRLYASQSGFRTRHRTHFNVWVLQTTSP